MHRSPAHPSPPKNGLKFLVSLFAFLLVLLGAGYYFFGDKALPAGRYVLAVLGDPLEVVLYDAPTNHWTTVQIPADTQMTGVEGLGEYRLDALWDVAATEATPSSVVMETLTHELGIPVTHYIAKKGDIWQKRAPGLIELPSVMSFSSDHYDTNVTIGQFIGLTRKKTGLKPETVTHFVLSDGKGIREKKARDGTTTQSFDAEQFDRLTDDAFQDLEVRQEGYRIAVFNTTQRALLGSRAARIISTVGGNVVHVGNEPTAVDACQLSGNTTVLASHTAQIIDDIFSCKRVVTTETGQADMIVKIGTVYANKYATTAP